MMKINKLIGVALDLISDLEDDNYMGSVDYIVKILRDLTEEVEILQTENAKLRTGLKRVDDPIAHDTVTNKCWPRHSMTNEDLLLYLKTISQEAPEAE